MKKDYSGNGSDEDEEEEYSDPATPLTAAQVSFVFCDSCLTVSDV